MAPETWNEGDYRVSTDVADLDVVLVHRELSRSYWAEGIPRALVEKSIRHSLCFGAFDQHSGAQVGFARVVSDFATFAYIGDVFVIQQYRKRGISKFLMKCIMAHPELQGLRRMCLGTHDAHTLYQRFGFKASERPQNWLEIRVPDIYRAQR